MLKFTYAFQPIVDCNAKNVFSYEALIRGKNNENPEEIYAQILETDLPKFDQEARNLAISMAANLELPCCLNLNFMPACLQFSQKYLLKTRDMVQQHGLSLEQLVIEILEQDIIRDHVTFTKLINEFRGQGIKVAIDDFGAGYSGLNLLVNFQPDIIKLDMQLIKNIDSHGPRQAIIKAIMQICISLGIDVIAEGVETLNEYHWLKSNGIYLFQGYLFAKPALESFPSVDFSKLIESPF